MPKKSLPKIELTISPEALQQITADQQRREQLADEMMPELLEAFGDGPGSEAAFERVLKKLSQPDAPSI